MNFQISESNDLNSQQLKVLKAPATASQLAFTSYVKHGSTPLERVVLIHGFTQSGNSFRNIARVLALQYGFEVVCVDLPGHGGSSEIGEQLATAADLLLPFGKDSIWVGYSLGSRHLLTLCLKHPRNKWRAILSGVNPGIEDETEKIQRYMADLEIAKELKGLINDERGFYDFLSRWTSLAIFQPREAASEDIQTRIRNRPESLAASLVNSSIGVQANLWPDINMLQGNFTLISGGADTKYLQIAKRMEASTVDHPGLSLNLKIIDGMGHAAIFDRPQTLIDAVAAISNT